MIGLGFGRSLTRYYRVRAKGGFAFQDSPWSNVVEVKPSWTTVLEAPVPERAGSGWKWTSVGGASGYVLQMSGDSSFDKTVDLYDGAKREWEDPSLARPLSSTLGLESQLLKPRLRSFGPVEPSAFRLSKYHRVKAKGGLTSFDSPWSNVVEVPFGG